MWHVINGMNKNFNYINLRSEEINEYIAHIYKIAQYTNIEEWHGVSLVVVC